MNDESNMNRETLQIELQRLIDGQMPEFERLAFLECLDEQPAYWREVALAYVEEQVLQAELSSSQVPAQPTAPALPPASSYLNLWASAAVVMIALFVGGVVGRYTSPEEAPEPNQIVNEVPRPQGGDPEVGQPEGGQSVANQEDYYMLLKPTIEQQPQPELLPWEYIAASMQQPVIGEETRATIRQHGYEVNEAPVLFVLEDDNGGHYMIPRRHITFTSHKE